MPDKTDASLEGDVLFELRWFASLPEHGIDVTVHDGIATLRGWVLTDVAKRVAISAVRRVQGVWATEVDLEVKNPGVQVSQDSHADAPAWSLLFGS
jgi:osmotically-inducible protein OsmY